MLDTVDPAVALDKKTFERLRAEKELKLGELQRQAHEDGLPVLLVFEGWNGAGKGVQINALLQCFDPRGFQVHTISRPNCEEINRPFLWRFWTKLPPKGRIAIYDRSWYYQTTMDRVEERITRDQAELAYHDIQSFERQLVDDGYLILKFFLHISAKEQKKRLRKVENDPEQRWRVTGDDWRAHQLYAQYWDAFEEMFRQTDTAFAPWHVVEAEDKRYSRVKIMDIIIAAVSRRLEEMKRSAGAPPAPASPAAPYVEAVPFKTAILREADLSRACEKKEYERKLPVLQERLRDLQYQAFREGVPLIIVFEGWDAAGKGGTIKRLTNSLDPRGYYVVPVGSPTDEERQYHYLWRFWRHMPADGIVAIFDRSWYGRVLVERVEGYARESEWRRAYREINEMEEHLANDGAVLLKFWLHIDADEQLKRFKAREADPNKQWKITAEDWRNRDKRDLYEQAIQEMFFRTSTRLAPWTVVESNCKYYARLKTLETVIQALEKRLK